MELVAGRPYVFDLGSARFDSFLVLMDSSGKKALASNDDAGDIVQDARIHFTPKDSGTYFLKVTSCKTGETGAYNLRIQGFQAEAENSKVKERLP